MTALLRLIATALGLLTGASAASADSGLTLRPGFEPWPRLQARLALVPLPYRADAMHGEPTATLLGGRLLGDMYVTDSLLGRGSAGGLRATSGLLVGPRAFALGAGSLGLPGSGWLSVDRRMVGWLGGDASAEPTATLPYLGLGYTGLSPHGGWGFSADLGIVALTPGPGVRLGRVVSGSQPLDDLLRELRLRPMLQLGVSYSF